MPIFHRANLKSEATGKSLFNYESLDRLLQRAIQITREEAPEYSGPDPDRLQFSGGLKASIGGKLLQSENQASIVITSDPKKVLNTQNIGVRGHQYGTNVPVMRFVLYGTKGGKIIRPLRFMDPKAKLAFWWSVDILHRFMAKYVTRGSTPANRFDLRAMARLRSEGNDVTGVMDVFGEANRIWMKLDKIGG